MKTSLRALLQSAWLLLTAVPDWPDAPAWARLMRALPILLPVAAMLALTGWKLGVRDPRLRAETSAVRPLLQLENQISTLRLNCSDQQARDLAERSEEMTRVLLPDPAKLNVAVETAQAIARQQHWEGSFQTGSGVDAPAEGAATAFCRIRARFDPAADNAERFPTLVRMLDALSQGKPRIDLTRLAIRADEEGRYSVEALLRLQYRVSHEKAAE